MKIYIVSKIECNAPYPIEVHYCTNYEKAIEFLRLAVADVNSGIDENTLIDIATDVLDVHFSKTKTKSLERKLAKEFLELGE